jgi:hypothetical protein
MMFGAHTVVLLVAIMVVVMNGVTKIFIVLHPLVVVNVFIPPTLSMVGVIRGAV